MPGPAYAKNSFISTPGVFYPGVLRDVKKSKEPLRPVFEAFINALEAVRDLPRETNEGQIVIKLFSKQNLVEPEFDSISIEDNGIFGYSMKSLSTTAAAQMFSCGTWSFKVRK